MRELALSRLGEILLRLVDWFLFRDFAPSRLLLDRIVLDIARGKL